MNITQKTMGVREYLNVFIVALGVPSWLYHVQAYLNGNTAHKHLAYICTLLFIFAGLYRLRLYHLDVVAKKLANEKAKRELERDFPKK